MGKRVTVQLAQDEYTTLKMWISSGKTEQRLVNRARIVLCAASGLTLKQTASEVGLDWRICMKWRKRFLSNRIEGLKDQPRRGRPAVITREERVEVMALARGKPNDGSNHWSSRKLAGASGLSKSTVHRILSEACSKPNKTEYWRGRSPYLEFTEKRTSILGLYLSPSENALVISVDEISQIQALDGTQAMPPRPSQAGRLTDADIRHGTSGLLAALPVHDGAIEGRRAARLTNEEFLNFLRHLYRKFPKRELHVIVDNHRPHKRRKVMEWASRRTRLSLHFTSAYASWLDQIEIWFGVLARDVPHGGVTRSGQEPVKRIMHFIKRHNETHAHPFDWTRAVDPRVAQYNLTYGDMTQDSLSNDRSPVAARSPDRAARA